MNDGHENFWHKPVMPWMCASRLFGPLPFNEYGLLQVLSVIRTVLGFCISVAIYDRFRAGDQQTSDVVSSIEFTIFISIGLAILLSIAVAVRDNDFSQDTLQPAGRAVLALAVLGGFALLDHLRAGHLNLLDLAAGLLFIWYVPFTWVSMVYWYLSPFGASDKSPFLGPIITGITVTAVTVISFIQGDGGPLPVLPWIGVTLCGLLTSLALVAGEIYGLQREITEQARRAASSPRPARRV